MVLKMVLTKNQKIIEEILLSGRSMKIAIILGFIAIFLVNIITLVNPTHGYELSIYDATPSIIWISLIISSLCGISIIVLEVYTKRCNYSNIWIYGLIILLISRVTILDLPYNRGYVAWQGDHMTHIGIVNEITRSGYVAPNNFYPITHIFISVLKIILDISTEFITKYSTTLISIFFVLSIYLIGKFLLNNKRATLLALAASGCTIFNCYDIYLMPHGWSVLFFPFALYIIIKGIYRDGVLTYGILAVIILILYPFFHTLSALMLTIILISISIIYTIINKFRFLHDKIQNHCLFPENIHYSALIAILIITWSVWTLSFKNFHLNIRIFFESITSNLDVNVLAGMSNKASKMNFNVFDLADLIIKVEGATIIYLILFLLGSYIFYITHRKDQEFKKIQLFIMTIIIFIFLYTSYLFNLLPGLSSIAGVRILSYIVALTPIFSGIVYFHIISKEKIVCAILCIAIMIIPVALSLFGTIPSPYVHRPTPQITTMDIHGMEWSMINKDIEISYISIMTPPYRFADAILGPNERSQRPDLRKNNEIVPDHFNYTENRYFSKNYPSSRYLILTHFDKIIYVTVYKEVGRFKSYDFFHLKNDPTVLYLYNNGEFDVYYTT